MRVITINKLDINFEKAKVITNISIWDKMDTGGYSIISLFVLFPLEKWAKLASLLGEPISQKEFSKTFMRKK